MKNENAMNHKCMIYVAVCRPFVHIVLITRLNWAKQAQGDNEFKLIMKPAPECVHVIGYGIWPQTSGSPILWHSSNHLSWSNERTSVRCL